MLKEQLNITHHIFIYI